MEQDVMDALSMLDSLQWLLEDRGDERVTLELVRDIKAMLSAHLDN